MIKVSTYIFSFLFVLIIVFLFNSCANQGQGPSGGPRDSIPPVVTSNIPTSFQTMFTGKEIILTFNEFVVPDNLSEKLVISPPLAKKPEIKTKGKSIVIKITEDLIPDRTYSIDFQDGIKDYTEGNNLEGLRMIFSTGSQIDSLQIGGYILNAFTHEPAKNALATLYTLNSDSAFQSLRPDFIARTNKEGYFLFDNLPSNNYKLYGLTDDDKNLYHSQVTELIAFADSLISPSVKFIAQPDTVIIAKDTVIKNGYNEYSPANVTILLFEEKVYSQFIVSFKRDHRDKCLIIFNEPISDSILVEPIDSTMPKLWNEIEFSNNKDSVLVYITDSVLVKTDTLLFRIKYSAKDSSGYIVTRTDTLKMLYNKPLTPLAKKKNDTPAYEKIFNFSTNLIASGFDLNKTIIIEAPSPIEDLKKEMVGFNEMINDSTLKPLNFELQPVKQSKRKFQLLFPLKENTKYQLSIDSALVKTLYGTHNTGLKTKFSTQKADYYGSIILSISGVENGGMLQLLKNSEKEELIREIPCDSLQKTVVFDFIKPEKYILKYYSDLNNNGKWDTGNLMLKLQPEPIRYFQKVINLKSNWEIKETWEINSVVNRAKKIVDESKEEKKSGEN